MVRVAAVVIGLLAAALAGGTAFTVLGPVPGVGVAAALLLLALAATRVERSTAAGIVALELLVFVGAAAGATVGGLRLADALRPGGEAAEAADAAALASAQGKLDAAVAGDAFRLELTEAELEAVVQDGLAADATQPLRRVDLDLRAGPAPADGDIAFTATFKRGGLEASGRLVPSVVEGTVDLDLVDLRLGSIPVQGLASDAVGGLVGGVAALDRALEDAGAEVVSLAISDDVLVLTGTRAGDDALTGTELLDRIRASAASAGAGVQPPPERLGPGTVDGLEAPGDPLYLALGDSLAANVGVASARDGYVSRFHRYVSERDGVAYGLRNLGRSGETAGSLLRGGQLAEAEAILGSEDVAIVTVDVGANDLLPLLQSAECAHDLTAPACQQRVAATTTAFVHDLGAILDRLRNAEPDATVLLLTPYNPFSLGFGTPTEEQSDAILAGFNGAAAEAAAARGVLVADGARPLRGTAAATTHMLDDPPDIHPQPIGYDVLAAALADALG